MVNSTDFGKRLQKILTYYGISATDFSNQISVNRSTISHLLSGRNKPSLDFVLKVLEKFPEVELYWLLNGKGIFPSSKIDSTPISTSTKSFSNSETSKKITNSEKNKQTFSTEALLTSSDSSIEQIIIFYKDGSFKVYKN